MTAKEQSSLEPLRRVRLVVRGAVQGVGFRPFVHRLATGLGLGGWVCNSADGVRMEVEGQMGLLEEFLVGIERDAPALSIIREVEPAWLPAAGMRGFEIRASEASGGTHVLILPDIATCEACLGELLDPGDRRYRHPFANCTHCGPRYTILEGLPYDRARTSMRRFAMCERCRGEYENPRDRRFHAQPIACPDCGPVLELRDAASGMIGMREAALAGTVGALREGRVVAVKGLGGFHLMVAAGDDDAVGRLRRRKERLAKPFAVMFADLESLRACCEVSELEERLLTSPAAPIVLLKRLESATGLSGQLAPGNPYLGAMLPATPLHHLLLRDLGRPVVATSGNRSEEPICREDGEALERLRGIADLFLVHDRPIMRAVDDSVVRVAAGREMVLRRARGYAPMTIELRAGSESRGAAGPPVVLAMGANLKGCLAYGSGSEVMLSQHLGDLECDLATDQLMETMNQLERLRGLRPEVIAVDAHPEYRSTRVGEALAAAKGLAIVKVQHHHAHALACMAENGIKPPALAVVWDGAGYGTDGTVWGGEFLRMDAGGGWTRAVHWRPFRLPGGDAAAREPRRAALGLLYECLGDAVWDCTDLPFLSAIGEVGLGVWRVALRRGIQAPLTTSVGRLFDAVASLSGIRQCNEFEGQAAMDLEFAADRAVDWGASYTVKLEGGVLDWQACVHELIQDARSGVEPSIIAARFHGMLCDAVVTVAREFDEKSVVLSGGCFQNRCLLEGTIERLRGEGFRPFWHRLVPPNDGGIALGQVAAVWQGSRR